MLVEMLSFVAAEIIDDSVRSYARPSLFHYVNHVQLECPEN